MIIFGFGKSSKCLMPTCLDFLGRYGTFQVTPPDDLRDLRLQLGLGRLRKASFKTRRSACSFKLNSSIRSELGADEGPITPMSEFDSTSSPMHCSTPDHCSIPSMDFNVDMGNTTPFMAMTPELSTSPRANPMDPNKLFPLFRPLAQKKVRSDHAICRSCASTRQIHSGSLHAPASLRTALSSPAGLLRDVFILMIALMLTPLMGFPSSCAIRLCISSDMGNQSTTQPTRCQHRGKKS